MNARESTAGKVSMGVLTGKADSETGHSSLAV